MGRESNTLLYLESPPPAQVLDDTLRAETMHATVRITFGGVDSTARLHALREWLAAALASVEGAIAKEAA
jgi:hypothetical protein